MNTNEIVISSKDAVLLSALVHRASHLPGTDDAVGQLCAALETARIIDSARMPHAAVGLGTTVEYVELPEGRPRTVTLAHPIGADAGRGRISVLSPVGRALLGRRPGSAIEIALPSGRMQRIKVVSVRQDAQDASGGH